MIFVECYPDELLLRTLGISRQSLRHERCKGNVVKRVRDLAQAVGLIDEDPDSTQPKELRNYQVTKETEGLRLLVHRDADRRKLVMVCPRLEEWIFRRSAVSGVSPAKFNLPKDAESLHRIPRYEQKPKFRQFLEELVAKDSSFALLKAWLQ